MCVGLHILQVYVHRTAWSYFYTDLLIWVAFLLFNLLSSLATMQRTTMAAMQDQELSETELQAGISSALISRGFSSFAMILSYGWTLSKGPYGQSLDYWSAGMPASSVLCEPPHNAHPHPPCR